MKKENYLEFLFGSVFILMTVAAFVVAAQRIHALAAELGERALAAAAQVDALKQEAVDRGFAGWVIKGQNETEFKWKEPIK
jgi:hypothetical protein